MFAVPGIAALIVFILARPQEFVPLLQLVPFLHLFTVLAVVGWVIDIRLRRLQPIPTPTLPWVIGFLGWSIVGIAVVAPDQLIQRILDQAVLFAMYGTLAHGVQRFRTFQHVAGVLVTTCLFITIVCFHQGLSPMQCIGGEDVAEAGDVAGTPDGRLCETNETCRGPEAEPGFEYRCEHVGLFGTYSIEERVRYRGELHDPNEVALMMSAGALSLLIAFAIRKRARSPLVTVGCVVAIVIVLWTVWMTQSRGGLVAALLVPGVYTVRRWGFWSIVPALCIAVPVLMLGGRSGEAAEMSTAMRYDAWATGLDMFKHSPVFGVGSHLFADHFFLTAHNSFVLTLAEMGFPGLVMFVAIIYLTFKILIVGLRELRAIPGSDVAQIWGMALLASMAGIFFQINTLSFAYHPVLWLFFGLVGAWCSSIRHHHPEFRIRMTWTDVVIVVLTCVLYAMVVLPVFLKLKGIT